VREGFVYMVLTPWLLGTLTFASLLIFLIMGPFEVLVPFVIKDVAGGGPEQHALILAAFGIGEGAHVSPWQTGVYWAEQARADLFAFTLDKTSGQFSPTTRYRDYAISRELIHWESQSATRADSETGRRYRDHIRLGSSVMLYARLRADERAFYFLGPARYVSHRSECPMAITWRLEHPRPGDLFAAFAAAVA